MWTAPHVNCQLRHPQRYAVTLGMHGGIAQWMTTFQARGPKRIPQVRYAITARHGARRSVPRQAPATLGSWRAPIAASTIFVTDGIWRRQIEPMLIWCMTAHHGISCDKRRPHLSPQLQPDMAQG